MSHDVREPNERKRRRRKRQNGMGSLFQIANGNWVAQVTDPVTGKQRRRYSKTENEGDRLLREMLNRLDGGAPAVDSRQTFRTFVEDWLAHRAAATRSPNSVYEYGSRLRKHALPHLGDKRLGSISQRDIESVLGMCVEAGLSRATVVSIRNALGAAFSDALAERLITRNPVTTARLPRMEAKKKPRIPATAEVQALHRSIPDVKGEAAVELGRILIVIMSTGARIGEVLAMRWGHIDEATGIWNVQDTLSRDVQGRTTFSSQTKTGDDREVVLTDEVLEALRCQREYVQHRASIAPVWSELDLVFPSTIGTAKDERNLRRLLKEAIPEWQHTFHGLRHWFSSVGLLDAGVGITQVSRMLGHSSTRTTTDLYGHLLEEGSQRVLDSITRTLKGEGDALG